MAKKKEEDVRIDPATGLQEGAVDFGLTPVSLDDMFDLGFDGVKRHQNELAYRMNPDYTKEFEGEDLSTLGDLYGHMSLIDAMDKRAFNQTTAQKLKRGLAKMGVTAATSFIEPFAAVIDFTTQGDLYDGYLTNQLDGINEHFSKELAHYYSQEELRMSAVGGMGKANFWTDKFLNGAGFLVGAVASGWVTGHTGIGAKLAQSITKAGNLMNAGTKFSKTGHYARMAASSFDETKAVVAGLAETVAAQKIVGMRGNQAMGGLIAALGESSLEARHAKHSAAEKMKTLKRNGDVRYKDLSDNKIEELATSLSNVNFAMNMALVGSTNAYQFGSMFSGSLKNAGKNASRNVGRESLDEAYDVAKKSKFRKGLEYTGTFLKNPLGEAFQEISQYSMEKGLSDFVSTKYDPKKGYLPQATDMIGDMVSSMASNLGTKEGAESAILGALLGFMGVPGLGGGSISDVREKIAQEKYDKESAEILNKHKLDPAIQEIMKSTAKEYEEAGTTELIRSVAGHLALEEEKARAVVNNDVLAYDTATQQQFNNYLVSRIKAGKYDDVIEDLEAVQKLSPEEFMKRFGIDKEEFDTNIKNVEEYVGTMINRAKEVNETHDILHAHLSNLGVPEGTKEYDYLFTMGMNRADSDILEKRYAKTIADMTGSFLTEADADKYISQLNSIEESEKAKESLLRDIENLKNQTQAIVDSKLEEKFGLGELTTQAEAVELNNLLNEIDAYKRKLESTKQTYKVEEEIKKKIQEAEDKIDTLLALRETRLTEQLKEKEKIEEEAADTVGLTAKNEELQRKIDELRKQREENNELRLKEVDYNSAKIEEVLENINKWLKENPEKHGAVESLFKRMELLYRRRKHFGKIYKDAIDGKLSIEEIKKKAEGSSDEESKDDSESDGETKLDRKDDEELIDEIEDEDPFDEEEDEDIPAEIIEVKEKLKSLWKSTRRVTKRVSPDTVENYNKSIDQILNAIKESHPEFYEKYKKKAEKHTKDNKIRENIESNEWYHEHAKPVFDEAKDTVVEEILRELIKEGEETNVQPEYIKLLKAKLKDILKQKVKEAPAIVTSPGELLTLFTNHIDKGGPAAQSEETRIKRVFATAHGVKDTITIELERKYDGEIEDVPDFTQPYSTDKNGKSKKIGKDKTPITNSSYHITARVFAVIDGEKVELGVIKPPHRFRYDGKPFDPDNVTHIAAMNNKFVDENGKLNQDGKAFRDNYKAMLAEFRKFEKLVEKKGDKATLSNSEVSNIFNISKPQPTYRPKHFIPYDKRKTLSSFKELQLQYSYTDSTGKTETITEHIFIFRDKGTGTVNYRGSKSGKLSSAQIIAIKEIIKPWQHRIDSIIDHNIAITPLGPVALSYSKKGVEKTIEVLKGMYANENTDFSDENLKRDATRLFFTTAGPSGITYRLQINNDGSAWVEASMGDKAIGKFDLINSNLLKGGANKSGIDIESAISMAATYTQYIKIEEAKDKPNKKKLKKLKEKKQEYVDIIEGVKKESTKDFKKLSKESMATIETEEDLKKMMNDKIKWLKKSENRSKFAGKEENLDLLQPIHDVKDFVPRDEQDAKDLTVKLEFISNVKLTPKSAAVRSTDPPLERTEKKNQIIGNTSFKRAEEKKEVIENSDNLTAGSFSKPGGGEDAIGISKDGKTIVISDGMGGESFGAFGSSVLSSAIVDILLAGKSVDSITIDDLMETSDNLFYSTVMGIYKSIVSEKAKGTSMKDLLTALDESLEEFKKSHPHVLNLMYEFIQSVYANKPLARALGATMISAEQVGDNTYEIKKLGDTVFAIINEDGTIAEVHGMSNVAQTDGILFQLSPSTSQFEIVYNKSREKKKTVTLKEGQRLLLATDFIENEEALKDFIAEYENPDFKLSKFVKKHKIDDATFTVIEHQEVEVEEVEELYPDKIPSAKASSQAVKFAKTAGISYNEFINIKGTGLHGKITLGDVKKLYQKDEYFDIEKRAVSKPIQMIFSTQKNASDCILCSVLNATQALGLSIPHSTIKKLREFFTNKINPKVTDRYGWFNNGNIIQYFEDHSGLNAERVFGDSKTDRLSSPDWNVINVIKDSHSYMYVRVGDSIYRLDSFTNEPIEVSVEQIATEIKTIEDVNVNFFTLSQKAAPKKKKKKVKKAPATTEAKIAELKRKWQEETKDIDLNPIDNENYDEDKAKFDKINAKYNAELAELEGKKAPVTPNIGDIFISESEIVYTVTGVTKKNIQWSADNGSKGNWSIARYNEFIREGRLTKSKPKRAPAKKIPADVKEKIKEFRDKGIVVEEYNPFGMTSLGVWVHIPTPDGHIKLGLVETYEEALALADKAIKGKEGELDRLLHDWSAEVALVVNPVLHGLEVVDSEDGSLLNEYKTVEEAEKGLEEWLDIRDKNLKEKNSFYRKELSKLLGIDAVEEVSPAVSETEVDAKTAKEDLVTITNAFNGSISQFTFKKHKVADKLKGTKFEGMKYKELKEHVTNLQKIVANSVPKTSIVSSVTGELVSWEEAVENVSKIIPLRTKQNPDGTIEIEDVKVLLENIILRGGITMGAVVDNVMYLRREGLAKGTEYHEAMHIILRAFLTNRQLERIFNIAKARYTAPTVADLQKLRNISDKHAVLSNEDLTLIYYEEAIADAFQDYMNNKTKEIGFLKKAFDKIIEFIDWISGKVRKGEKDELITFFKSVQRGDFKNAEVKNNSFFSKTASVPAPSLLRIDGHQFDSSMTSSRPRYLDAITQSRITNTIASRVSKNNMGAYSDQIILKEIERMKDHYAYENWEDILDRAFEKETAYGRVGAGRAESAAIVIEDIETALSDVDNISVIMKDVKTIMDMYGLDHLEESDIEALEQELNTDNWRNELNEVGGFLNSLSREMKQYIALTTMGVDEFNLGLTEEELSEERFQMSINPFAVHGILERGLHNTSAGEMLGKLRYLSETNEQLKAFYTKFIRDIFGVDNWDGNLDGVSLINPNLYNRFISAYKNIKLLPEITLIDKGSGKNKTFNANAKDVDKVQFEAWEPAFTHNLERENEYVIEILEELHEALNVGDVEEINPNYDKETDDIRHAVLRVDFTKKAEYLSEILKEIGISLNPNFIRYSLIHSSLSKMEKKGVRKEFKEDLEFYRFFSGTEPITEDDAKQILTKVKQGKNPFRKGWKIDDASDKSEDGSETVVDDNDVDDTSTIGRLYAIARGNAMFDESIGSTTYISPDGKRIYSHVKPFFIGTEVEKYRKKARIDFMDEIKEANSETDPEKKSELLKAAKKSFVEAFDIVDPNRVELMFEFLSKNHYLNHPDADKIFDSRFFIKTIAGLRETALDKTEDGDVYEKSFRKKKEGSMYGGLNSRAKMIQAMNLYVNTKIKKIGRKKSMTFATYNVGVNEDANTATTILLPKENFIDGGVYDKTKGDREDKLKAAINDTALDRMVGIFKQEYTEVLRSAVKRKEYRDALKKGNEKNVRGVIENYHDSTDAEKVFTIWNFQHLKDNDTYSKVIKAATEGKSASDMMQELGSEIREMILEDLVENIDTFFTYIQESKHNIDIVEKKDDDSLKSKLLPSEFLSNPSSNFIGQDVNMGELANFWLNQTIQVMTFNQLIDGYDGYHVYKGYAGKAKRNKLKIGAGPGSSGTFKLAWVKDHKHVFGKDEEDPFLEANHYIEGEYETTDGQSVGDIFFLIDHHLRPKGKLTGKVKRIYFDKILRGKKVTQREYEILRQAAALTLPKKLQYKDAYTDLKTSTIFLYREGISTLKKGVNKREFDRVHDELEAAIEDYLATGRIEDKNEVKRLLKETTKFWEAIPNTEYWHNMLNKMHNEGHDMIAYTSAGKEMRFDVREYEDDTWVSHPHQGEHLKEQVVTDAIKGETTDSTQKLQVISKEQNWDLLTYFRGRSLGAKSMGRLVNKYENLKASRVRKEFNRIKKQIIDKNGNAVWEEVMNHFQRSMLRSGGNSFMQTMVSTNEKGERLFSTNITSVAPKVEAMFLDYISGSLKHKRAGWKGTLKTDVGHKVIRDNDNNVITQDYWLKNKKKIGNNYSVSRLRHRVPEYNEDGEIIGYYSEIMMPKSFLMLYGLKIGDKIPSSVVKLFGTRIPSQDNHSMGAFKIVDWLPAIEGNAVILPREIAFLSGADFDIDAEYLDRVAGHRLGKRIVTYGEYLDAKDKKSMLKAAFREHITYHINDNKDVRNEIKKIEENDDEYLDLKMKLATLSRNLEAAINRIENRSLRKQYQDILEFVEIAYEQKNTGELLTILDDLLEDPSEQQKLTFSTAYIAGFKSDTESEVDPDEDINVNNSEIHAALGSAIEGLIEKVKEIRRDPKTIEDKKTIERVTTLKELIAKALMKKRRKIQSLALERLGIARDSKEFDEKHGDHAESNWLHIQAGNIEAYDPMNKGELENALLDMQFQFLHNKSTKEISATPVRRDYIEDDKKYIEDIKKEEKGRIEPKGTNSPTDQSLLRDSIDVGKENVGIGAVLNIVFNYLHETGKHTNPTEKDGSIKGIGINKMSDPMFDNENHSYFGLSHKGKAEILTALNDEFTEFVRVNELNTTYISSATDNANELDAAVFNLTADSLAAALTAIHMNVPKRKMMLLLQQPLVQQYFTEINKHKGEITTKEEDKFSIGDITNMYQLDYDLIKANSKITMDQLEQAFIYSINPGKSTISSEEFDAIQNSSLKEMLKARKYADYLRNLSRVLSLIKGFPSTFAEVNNIKTSLKELGLETYVINENKDPYDIDNIGIRYRIVGKDKKGKDINALDAGVAKVHVLDLFETNEFLRTEVQVLHIMDKISGKFFISQTPWFLRTFDMIRNNLKSNVADYTKNYKTITRQLLTYLEMRAWKEENSGKLPTDAEVMELLLSPYFAKQLEKMKNHADPRVSQNMLVKHLTTNPHRYEKIPMFEDKVFHFIESASHQNPPDNEVRLMMAGYAELDTHLDPDVSQFAKDLILYLAAKDGFQFLNKSFVNKVDPEIALGNLSDATKKIEKVLARPLSEKDKGFFDVFGAYPTEVAYDFIEMFSRWNQNRSYLISIAGESRMNSKGARPILFDEAENEVHISIFAGIDRSKKATKEQKEENKDIINVNKAALIGAGFKEKIVDKYEEITFPDFINFGGEVYQLIRTEKGRREGTKYKVDKVEDRENFRAKGQTFITADKVVYKKVENIFSKEIAPWYFSLKFINDYIAKHVKAEKDTYNIKYKSSNPTSATLSNFAERPFEHSGVKFSSVEQAFQYAKAMFMDDSKLAEKIEQSNTGFGARNLGRQVSIMNDKTWKEWDKASYDIMKTLMRKSFEQNDKARAALISTGEALLTHKLGTKDDRWTADFPDILMELRDEFTGGDTAKKLTKRAKDKVRKKKDKEKVGKIKRYKEAQKSYGEIHLSKSVLESVLKGEEEIKYRGEKKKAGEYKITGKEVIVAIEPISTEEGVTTYKVSVVSDKHTAKEEKKKEIKAKVLKKKKKGAKKPVKKVEKKVEKKKTEKIKGIKVETKGNETTFTVKGGKTFTIVKEPFVVAGLLSAYNIKGTSIQLILSTESVAGEHVDKETKERTPTGGKYDVIFAVDKKQPKKVVEFNSSFSTKGFVYIDVHGKIATEQEDELKDKTIVGALSKQIDEFDFDLNELFEDLKDKLGVKIVTVKGRPNVANDPDNANKC